MASKKFTEQAIFGLQTHCFIEKLHGVIGMTFKKYEEQRPEVRWEKVKEEIKEFLDTFDYDKISEE